MQEKRQSKFCKFVASGLAPYQAALKAGYKTTYAKNFAHKLLEKYGNEIEKLKPKVQEVLEKEFSYDVKTSFNKLIEIQELALLPNSDGEYNNLNAAIKAEELKGKMYGCYERNNKQQQTIVTVNNNVVDDVLKKIKDL